MEKTVETSFDLLEAMREYHNRNHEGKMGYCQRCKKACCILEKNDEEAEKIKL